MKLDELRRRARQSAASKGKPLEQVSQQVNIYGNPGTQRVLLKFTYAANNIEMTVEQAMDHAYKVLSAAIVCGAQFDRNVLEAQLANARLALANQKKNPGGN